MRLQLCIEKSLHLNGSPIFVGMNLLSGYLHINDKKIFLGGYLNCVGPDVSTESPSLSFIYSSDREKMIQGYAERMRRLTNFNVTSLCFHDLTLVHMLELYFPPLSRIALANYDLSESTAQH